MAKRRPHQVSQADVDSLADKLAAFSATLTPAEQHVLHAVVQRARANGQDVQGFWEIKILEGPSLPPTGTDIRPAPLFEIPEIIREIGRDITRTPRVS